MATYTQGYQPYMPDWQPFTPDYKFLSDVLQVKTDRYNTNYKALNDLYSKVVYSDLSRKDTNEMRNQYAENLGKQLELISGMDLSLAQNVDSARQLFKPFFEEDLIVKDLVFTKQYQNEMQYANTLMNSPDQSQRELYWQTGVKALQYQMDDFVNTSADKALQMGAPRYTPDADLYEKAVSFLKESGLDVTQEYIDETGFFIVKDRNGNLITNQAFEMAQKALLDDPMVQQAYYTDAYVKARDFAQAGIEAGRFSSVDEGQATWAKETIGVIEQQLAARSTNQQEQVITLRNANINWDNYIKESGIIPGSDEEKEYIEQKRSYETALQSLERTQETLKSSQGTMDQSSQGLLNRAYNLLMGYNIQDDLSGAAIAYSNINRSRELKVNEYKKQQLQFQHDFAKMAIQNQYNLGLENLRQTYRIQLEEEKARIANPHASIFDSLFSTQTLDNKTGTEYVLTDLSTGLAVNPETADYIAINQSKLETLRVDVTERQVDVSLKALELLMPNANNSYTVGGVTADLPTIKKFLLANPDAADKFYTEMANKFTDSDELMRMNPGFVKRNNGNDYRQLAANFESTTSRRMQLDHVISTGNKVMYDNFMTILTTELVKEAKEVREGMKRGSPSIFQNTSNGAMDIKTEDEFVKQYVTLARQRSIKDEDGISVGWRYTDKPTDRNIFSTIGLGFSKRFPTSAIAGTPGEIIEINTFNERAAIATAKSMYADQRALINNTLNGTLETVAEQNASEKKLPHTRMFQPWDPNQYMRGSSLEEMQTGDALKSPYYKTFVDPISMRTNLDQIQAVNDLVQQVRRTSGQELTFIAGDVGENEDANLLENDPTARKIYEAWMQDMARFRDPKASKTNMPIVTIGYAPVYGPSKEEALGKDRAAYVMSFSPEWLSSLQGTSTKPGILSADDVQTYSNITISFPQSSDINPKKTSEFNFSATRNEIMQSPQRQLVRTVDGGGTIRVYPDANANFIAEITSLQFNPETGNFDKVTPQRNNLTELMNQSNESIGYIDKLVSTYISLLGRVAEQNNQDQANNKKVNGRR